MELRGKDIMSDWRDRARGEIVHTPQAHDGVGRALRNAFEGPLNEMPRDFGALLDRLR